MRRTALTVLALLAGAVAACGDRADPAEGIGYDEILHERRSSPGGVTQLAVSPLDGSATRQLSDFVLSAHLPAVRPDGRLVAYHQQSRLWIFDVAGREARQLSFGPALDGSPRWTPDGKGIVYASTRYAIPSTSDICIRDLAGGEPVCLTPADEFNDNLPDVSPDGTQIVWQRYDANLNGDLWIMNADGTNQRLLLDYSVHDGAPQWSPDGRFILFQSFRYGLTSQFILELATGSIRPVLGDSLAPVFIQSAAWWPDGQSVIVEVLNPNNRFARVDLATGEARFINDDTLSYNSWPSMRR
jgi:Tol biopolymer transport system component